MQQKAPTAWAVCRSLVTSRNEEDWMRRAETNVGYNNSMTPLNGKTRVDPRTLSQILSEVSSNIDRKTYFVLAGVLDASEPTPLTDGPVVRTMVASSSMSEQAQSSLTHAGAQLGSAHTAQRCLSQARQRLPESLYPRVHRAIGANTGALLHIDNLTNKTQRQRPRAGGQQADSGSQTITIGVEPLPNCGLDPDSRSALRAAVQGLDEARDRQGRSGIHRSPRRRS